MIAPIQYALWMLAMDYLSIDEDGRIWRTHELRRNGSGQPGKWVPICWRRAENVGNKGYLRLSLQMPDTKRLRSVQAHRVIWVWNYGPIPEGLEPNHNLAVEAYDNGEGGEFFICAKHLPEFQRLEQLIAEMTPNQMANFDRVVSQAEEHGC